MVKVIGLVAFLFLGGKIVRSRASYRRIGKYYKSVGRWRLERERRKQVLQLREEGLSYAEIAERLGVCERTVKRDMAKVKPYYERKVRGYLCKLDEEMRVKVEGQLEGKSLVEKFNFLTKMRDDRSGRFKQRKYSRHQVTVTIDLDAMAAGGSVFYCTPKPPFSVKYPFYVKFEIVKGGKKKIVGGFTLSPGSERAEGRFGR